MRFRRHSGSCSIDDCLQAGDAVGWVCKADLESHILIATSAGYLLRFRITPIVARDFDDLDSNTALVR